MSLLLKMSIWKLFKLLNLFHARYLAKHNRTNFDCQGSKMDLRQQSQIFFDILQGISYSLQYY
jgi:hypothetical protein